MAKHYPQISNEHINALLAEKERTGMGWAAIIRYAKRIEVHPRTTKLNSSHLYQYEKGGSSIAIESDVLALLNAYRSIQVLGDEIPHDQQIIIIDEALRNGIVNALKARPNSLRRVVMANKPPPKGLSSNLLTKLGKGACETIVYSHLCYIREELA